MFKDLSLKLFIYHIIAIFFEPHRDIGKRRGIENFIFSHSAVIVCRAKRLLLVAIDYVSQPVGGHVFGLKMFKV
jgi:hypothetical protein